MGWAFKNLLYPQEQNIAGRIQKQDSPRNVGAKSREVHQRAEK